MAKWWERSPPTNVARIQIPVSTPFVGWVCGWFLLGYDRFLSGYSGFPLSSKTNISNFQSDQESGRRRTTLWMCYLQIIIIIIIIYIFIFIVMLGSIGILAFLGFIRMNTTISHPLDRSFFRIWKEAFETHWVTSRVNFIWGPLIQVSLYFFCFQFQRRGWISASCSRHPHHLGGQCFCRVKLHRSWCRRTQTSGVFFRLYAEVMQL